MIISQKQRQAISRIFLWNLVPMLIAGTMVALFLLTNETILTRQLTATEEALQDQKNTKGILSDSIQILHRQLDNWQKDATNKVSLLGTIEESTKLLEELDKLLLANLRGDIESTIIRKQLEELTWKKEDLQQGFRRQEMIDTSNIAIRNTLTTQFNQLYWSKEQQVLAALDEKKQHQSLKSMETAQSKIAQVEREVFSYRMKIIQLEKEIATLQIKNSNCGQNTNQRIRELATELNKAKKIVAQLNNDLGIQYQGELSYLQEVDERLKTIAKMKWIDYKKAPIKELANDIRQRKLALETEAKKKDQP